MTLPDEQKPIIDKCIVCSASKRDGSYYCSRDCWATCPPILFRAAVTALQKNHLMTLRDSILWLLNMNVNSRSLGEVLGVSHGTICRWRLEVIRRLNERPTGLGILDQPAEQLEGFILDLDDAGMLEDKREIEA